MQKQSLFLKWSNAFKIGFLFFLFIACKAPKATLTNNIAIPQVSIPQTNSNNLDSILAQAHYGICIFDVQKNSFLQSYQSNKYFIPASNLKIATCYAALKYLTDSLVGLYYFEDDTSIQIKGAADPTFLNLNFEQQPILNWLQTKSSKKIYLFNSNFNTKAYANGWSWDDYLEPFMAERSSFPINENLVTFNYSNGFKTMPKYFKRNISSTFDASNQNFQFNVTKKLGANTFDIFPGKNTQKKIPFATEAENELLSNQLTAQLLSDTLKQTVNSRPIFSNLKWKTLYSQPKDAVLQSMMFRSDNFIAEQLLLMVSNELFNEMNESKLIQYILNNDFSDLPQAPKWVDGCGLSRYNLISPEDFVSILNKMKSEFGWQRISKIFPKGNEGTLKNMFLKNPNQVFAKSGTLSNNYSLSGYLIANSGKEFIFSIMVNNHQLKLQQVKTALENYLTKIIEEN